MRELTKNVQVKRVLSPVSVSNNTAQVGQVIDHRGYESACYVIATGSLADDDATFAVLVEESDVANMSGATTVADADLVSQTPGVAAATAAGFQFDDDDEVRKVGYIGRKRYTRLTITPSGNGSAALLAAVCVLGHPGRAPVPQVPA